MAEAAEGESPASLKAVLVGATGVTGRRLLVELIKAKVRGKHLILLIGQKGPHNRKFNPFRRNIAFHIKTSDYKI